MDKKSFFIKAMQSGRFKKLDWIISAFSLTKQDPDASKTNIYDYKIISDVTSYSFIEPGTNAVIKIEDGIVGQPLFSFKDKLTISSNDIPNSTEITETTYGRFLFNWIVLVNVFGTKITYKNSKIKLSEIEDIILSKLEKKIEMVVKYT